MTVRVVAAAVMCLRPAFIAEPCSRLPDAAQWPLQQAHDIIRQGIVGPIPSEGAGQRTCASWAILQEDDRAENRTHEPMVRVTTLFTFFLLTY